MKAILVYNLPKEKEQYEAAYNGLNYKSAINELDENLRSEMKHKDLSEDTYKAFEYCRNELRRILEQDNLYIE